MARGCSAALVSVKNSRGRKRRRRRRRRRRETVEL